MEKSSEISSACDPDDGQRLLGLAPRTIPFRSASFSQVDVTSDGKYIQRTPSKPQINLVPTAFCLTQTPTTPPDESVFVHSTSPQEPPNETGVVISHSQSRSCPAQIGDSEDETLPRLHYSCEIDPPPVEFCAELQKPCVERPESLSFILGGDDDFQQGIQAQECHRGGSLLRQSSAQSDSASDEPLPIASLSDSCPSPPQRSRVSLATLRLGSSADDSSSDSGKPSASSLPPDFPKGAKDDKRKDDGQKDDKKKEGTSCNLVGFYKRPLRGPYGEMLEAEMKKLLPRREGPSSGPTVTDKGSPLDSNNLSLLLGSLDDINLNVQHNKHSPASRSRKVSTNTSQPAKDKESWSSGGTGLHQRTASTPSDIRYTTNIAAVVPHTNTATLKERRLEGTPRGHVLAEILETERSYVEALRTIVKNYMEPLKDIIEDGLIDEIFFQVPRILWHHERLLSAFQKRVLDDTQSLGDVVLEAFRQTSLQECYSLFVRNWKNAKGALKLGLASKSHLARFLEKAQSEHKGKLSLDALLIMPIQRIPRYELLFKELLKHTQPIHEDHSRLILLLDKLRKFALHIDCASVDPGAGQGSRREVEIEGWPVGLGKLVREEICPLTIGTPSNRKERALFLLPDALLIASIKRKGNRKTQSGFNPTGCKYKLLMKAKLGNITVLSDDHEDTKRRRGIPDAEDFRTLHRILELASTLKCPHSGLDSALAEMMAISSRNPVTDVTLELQIRGTDSSEGSELVKLFFSSVDRRTSWLTTFNETVERYMRYGNGSSADVEFFQAVPIRKTRAGLLLSCAAPVYLQGKQCQSDVWVANSDGYVGQICILNLSPEPPSITSCNGVCNSRITCMAPIPPQGQVDVGKSSTPSCSHQAQSPLGSETLKSLADKPEGWSVWLGTEDGGLHIYEVSDNSIRVKKNRYRVQHKAQLNAITYFEDRVFVALGNGDVVVYSRHGTQLGWATEEPSWVTIGTPMTPVNAMLCVEPNLWCASGSAIKVYGNNHGMLELHQCIHVTTERDENRPITAMVTTEDWVWVAIQGSTTLVAFDATTFQMIHQVNVASHVTKILAGCDEIIRQHKSACLRVTALFVSLGQTLWIGTSGGVILTLSPANSSEARVIPLSQGHTGQVRFLTACRNNDTWTVISGGDGHEEFKQVVSSPTSFAAMVTSLMGDSSGEPCGREDSTNHLLIWKIHKRTRHKQ